MPGKMNLAQVGKMEEEPYRRELSNILAGRKDGGEFIVAPEYVKTECDPCGIITLLMGENDGHGPDPEPACDCGWSISTTLGDERLDFRSSKKF